ncbi:hypothetical protein ABZ929_26120 [Streptomyces physcomitrii]|uniref:hypothetical protein n=1 Tax=Streptomyces physcomitrii TaxID=2724184 RepID=UPI003417A1E4
MDFSWDGMTLCEQVSVSEALPNPVALTWDRDKWQPIAQSEALFTSRALQQEVERREIITAT